MSIQRGGNKTGRAIKILLIIIGLIVLIPILTFILTITFKLCPPMEGPWPMPPWCVAVGKNPSTPSSTSATLLDITVEVPKNTPESSEIFLEVVNDKGNVATSVKMDKVNAFTWNLARKFDTGELKYRYSRGNWGFVGAEEFTPDSKKGHRTVIIGEKSEKINDKVSKWRWLLKEGDEPSKVPPSKAGLTLFESRVKGESFQKGALMVDFWWNNFYDLIDSTDKRLKENGFEWIEIAPPWDYKQVNPAPIMTAEGFGHTYKDKDLDFHLNKMKSDGFKVFLSPQICCVDTNAAKFSDAWWDEWFKQYENYCLYFADYAAKYDVEMLVLSGDQIAVSQKPKNYKERLHSIFLKVREKYKGKIGKLLYIGGEYIAELPELWPNPTEVPFIEEYDFYAINFWIGLTNKNDPTQQELSSNAKTIFNARLKPLYEEYGKPVVLQQVAYPSIDGGLRGEAGVDDPNTALWEEYSNKFSLDLEEQAMGYEAVMQATAETPFLIGIYPFTYWSDDFPLTKEYNIRGKPAEEVLSDWYKSIK